MTFRRMEKDYLPEGYMDTYLAEMEKGGPPHLISSFKQVQWPEPIAKSELESDREYIKSHKLRKAKEKK